MTKSVYIIILNWNGREDTVECLESCRKLDYSPYEIVVVDNGSVDGSESYIRSRFPGIRFIQTGANLGYAGGNNAGIRFALAEGADCVWLLNNDTVVDPGALSALMEIAETDPAAGMVGSKILSYSQPSVLLYAGGHIDLAAGDSEHIGRGCVDDGRFDLSLETGYITGCSLLVKRSVIEEVGLMNENYFLYFEETDWCVRAKRGGYKLVYAPGSVVYHKESVSVKKIKGIMHYYLTRNRLFFIRQNGIGVRWLNRFGDDFYCLLRHIYRRDSEPARAILTAYRHWITGYMGPLDRLVKIRRPV